MNTFSSIGQKAISKEEKRLGIKEGTIIERMNLIYQGVLNHQDEIIRDMNKEFPKSKIHRRIKELIHTRAKKFKRAGLNLS